MTWEFHITSALLYQVDYQASLLCQKSHTYAAGYTMQALTYISLQIMHYGKQVIAKGAIDIINKSLY